MGTYYRWKCDSRREFFDPGELLGPRCEPGRGYGVKGGSVPYSAWVVACLQLDRWYGHPVRLVADCSDDYDCDGYEEVSRYVLRTCLHLAPTQALRFLAGEASGGEEGGDPSVRAFTDERAEREALSARLVAWAEGEWPHLCTTSGCRHYGGNHDGEHDIRPEVEEAREVARYREFVCGSSRVAVEPGEEVVQSLGPVSLQPESRHPGYDPLFRIDRIIFLEEMVGSFVLRRVTVRGEGPTQCQEILPTVEVPVLGTLPVNLSLGPGQSLEVAVRNTSTSRQVFQFALYGTIKILEERGENHE